MTYLYTHAMPTTRSTRISFHIPLDLKRGLEALRVRDGISESEAVRRALASFLHEKGIDFSKASQEAAPRRARTRRRT
jgi:Arc/MetJ-type ribon-helix-helix transcriptional regulator